MYEHHSKKLLPMRQFVFRLLNHGVAVAGLMAVSLAFGIAGYMHWARLGRVDAFLNAAMLLGGMGPVNELPSRSAKVFAGVYALYSGLVFIASAGILVAPVAHRIMHKLHLGD